MDKMTKEQAAELLTNYQQWRKGRVDYFPVSPAKLSQAIDLAIENLISTDTKVVDSDEPDWSKAPEWANYYAIDADGQRWWAEEKPESQKLNFVVDFGQYDTDNAPERMQLFKRPEQ